MSHTPGSYDDYPGPASYGSTSFPNLSYADLEQTLATESKVPRILLMGPRRSGKSSIERVVFHKMSPHETLFLESTNDVRCKDIFHNDLVKFQILDFPGNFSFDSKSTLDASVVFKSSGALVFVIDGQDDETYTEAVDYFMSLAKQARQINPKIGFHILINKVDGDAYLSDDHKIDCQREIQQQISDELVDLKLKIYPSFHLTSIYDHTIYEAFSKIVQKLIPQLTFLENLLDSLITSCGIEKAFLFDVQSKIYVATDSNPVDMQTYELCSDMIDVVGDVSYIYGNSKNHKDTESAATIQLGNNYMLYLKEVNKLLALVCLMRNDSFTKSGFVDYNIARFQKGIEHLFQGDKDKDAKEEQ